MIPMTAAEMSDEELSSGKRVPKKIDFEDYFTGMGLPVYSISQLEHFCGLLIHKHLASL